MRKPSSIFQKNKQSIANTPAWALEKIREAKAGEFTALDLSLTFGDPREKLTKLPVEILELPGVTTLNLSFNKISTLPETITQLQSLTALNLSGNQFDILPETIGELRTLTALDLSRNQLSTLPEAISELQKLTDLELSYNQLSSLPEAITRLQNLTTLYLNRNQLSILPETITRLQNLTALYLSGNNELSTLPKTIGELQNLTALDLSYNQLSLLPEAIGELQNLTALYLSRNLLMILPDAIGALQNLTALYLSGNQLNNFPEAITRLQNLTALYLSSNQLNNFPEAITRLQNLTMLDLSDNQLSAIPRMIGQLQELTTLELSYNQLSTLPETIGELQELTTLNLSRNQLSILPEAIGELQNLTALDLSRNQLSTLPEKIGTLQNLTILNLRSNELRTLPETIGKLQNLTAFDLSRNQLSILPDSIGELHNLTNLNLNTNQLSALPEAISELHSLTTLGLDSNPLINPPTEIAQQGVEALRQYFRQLNQEGEDYLYEAKLLILGEGGAGKTTLARKLLNTNYTLRKEKSTTGVNILKWSFPIEENRQFTANIWDFGGQEIYHATHQFFLTRRSLYVLVADTRKEDTDFYYWLNIAELLSDNSPLLIINNEKEDRQREINERALKGEFNCLKEVLATNLATNRGLEEVKEEIEHHIKKLPHIGTPLPRTWIRVRELLEKDQRSYISLDEYLSVCRENGFAKRKDALQLSGYLHDIGVFLHFQDEPLLKKTVILKPKWGTDAVYKVLDNKAVIRNLGRFTREDLDRIWDTPEYESMRDELLQLMMKFRLCYEIPTQKGTYIAPQLLKENEPEYEWDEKDNLIRRCIYEFMPKGILTQLIVVMHPYIQEQRIVWKSGVVIEKDNTRAEMIEYYGKRELRVRVAGSQAGDLLAIIRHQLKQIHDTYQRLKYDELVRCNCPACKHSQEPHFYAVAKLLEFRAHNHLEIQCQKPPFRMVNVTGLLGDTIDPQAPPQKKADVTYVIYGGYHNYEKGDNRMTEINQNIDGSTIYGSVVAAESIKDSFNTIEKSNAEEDLKEQLKQLAQAVDAMAKALPKDKAEEVADDMKRLAEEATKQKPNAKWYSVSIDGLIAAAQNLGRVGDEVIDLAGKVRKILTGGLL